MYSLSSDGSGSPLLLEEADGDYFTSHAESYLEWPATLMRRVPLPRQLSVPTLLDYLQKADFLTVTSPARITRYTDSQNPNVSPDVEGWVLTTSSWGGSDEIVLVRIVDGRLVAANPP